MDHFDPYNVFLAIAINIPVLLMTGSPSSCPSTFPDVLLAHASLDDWPIVAKHANTDELERQYKCDACDNYVRFFYFTCWNHYVYSLQDLHGTNRTAASTLSLRRLPGPGPAAIWFAACSGWGPLSPAGGPPLLVAGASSCPAAKPNSCPIPRGRLPPPANIQYGCCICSVFAECVTGTGCS